MVYFGYLYVLNPWPAASLSYLRITILSLNNVVKMTYGLMPSCQSVGVVITEAIRIQTSYNHQTLLISLSLWPLYHYKRFHLYKFSLDFQLLLELEGCLVNFLRNRWPMFSINLSKQIPILSVIQARSVGISFNGRLKVHTWHSFYLFVLYL